jgi:hypothetical protein
VEADIAPGGLSSPWKPGHEEMGMKKVIIGLLLTVVLLIGGAIWFVYSNLDSLVEQAIETAGTAAAGTPVRVDSVAIDLMGGSATVRGFTLASPAGYSNEPMFSFAEFAVAIDLTRMNSQNIGILSVTARNPRVVYEARGGTSNVDVLSQRFTSDAAPTDSGSEPQMHFDIGSIVIEDIAAVLISDRLANPVEVNIGDIRLQNLSGTSTEVADQALSALTAQIATSAGRALLNLTPEQLRAAGDGILDTAADAQEAATGELDEATQDLRERAGNLLRGN